MRLSPAGGRETVPVDALRPGDLVAVAPGTRVPVDGTVAAGRSEIDPALLTGETLPEAVAAGDAVRAGMLNLTGALDRPHRRARRGHAAPPDRPARRGGRAQPQPLRDPRRARGARPMPPRCSSSPSRRWPGGGCLDRRLAQGDERRRGGPHHHLPLRPRARGARRADRRLGPAVPRGRAAQGRHRPRAARRDRHRRPRQDRHADHRPPGADQRRARSRPPPLPPPRPSPAAAPTRCRAPSARRPRTPASGRRRSATSSRSRARAPRASSPTAGASASDAAPGSGRRGRPGPSPRPRR